MAEGDVRRQLVRLLSGHIAVSSPEVWARFVDGVSLDDRLGVPPVLGVHRPDIYAVVRGTRHTIIGEAKTANDIDNDHTKRQLAAYFEHLGAGDTGEIWMAVPLISAGVAHRVCRVVRQGLGISTVPFTITGWLFGPKPLVETWHG